MVLLWLVSWALAAEEPTPPALEKLINQQDGQLLPVLRALPGKPLTLEECYEIALVSHPQLSAQRAQVDLALAQADNAWSRYNPTLAGTLNRTWNTVSPFAFPIQVTNNQTQIGLNVTHTLWDFGQRQAQAESAEWTLRSAHFGFQKARLDQFQAVQSAYVQVLSNEMSEAIQAANYERTLFMQDFATRLYRAGQKSMIDVSQATTQTAAALVELQNAKNQVQNARLALAQAVGVDGQQLLDRPLTSILESPVTVAKREQALVDLENNPGLLNLETQALSLEWNAEYQLRTNNPTVSGGILWGLQGMNQPEARFWQAGLSVSVPFFNPGVPSSVRQFRAQAAQVRYVKDNTRLQLLQQLDTAYSDLAWGEKRVQAGKREVELALANLALAYKRYRAGLADITEQINARAFVNSAQVDYVSAFVSRKLAEGRLLQVIGQLPLAPQYDPKRPQIPVPALPPLPKGVPPSAPDRLGEDER